MARRLIYDAGRSRDASRNCRPSVLSHLQRNWGVSIGRRGNMYGTPVVYLNSPFTRIQGTTFCCSSAWSVSLWGLKLEINGAVSRFLVQAQRQILEVCDVNTDYHERFICQFSTCTDLHSIHTINQIKSYMSLITVDGPQPSYNLPNMWQNNGM